MEFRDGRQKSEKLRRAVLDLVAGRKMESKNGMVEILSFSFWQAFCIQDRLMGSSGLTPLCKVSSVAGECGEGSC